MDAANRARQEVANAVAREQDLLAQTAKCVPMVPAVAFLSPDYYWSAFGLQFVGAESIETSAHLGFFNAPLLVRVVTSCVLFHFQRFHDTWFFHEGTPSSKLLLMNTAP